jgi:ribonuclease P protein component
MFDHSHRLRREKDFQRVFTKGRFVWDSLCLIKFKKNDLPISRFSVVVGKKVSKSAVVRNRLRRQVREIIRLKLNEIEKGYDIIFLIQPKALGTTFKKLQEIILFLLKKGKIKI